MGHSYTECANISVCRRERGGGGEKARARARASEREREQEEEEEEEEPKKSTHAHKTHLSRAYILTMNFVQNGGAASILIFRCLHREFNGGRRRRK